MPIDKIAKYLQTTVFCMIVPLSKRKRYLSLSLPVPADLKQIALEVKDH